MIADQDIDIILEGLEDAFQILGYHDGMAVLERRIVNKVLNEPKLARFLKDMEKYDKPRLQDSPASAHNQERQCDGLLNYFAPKKNLQVMLSKEWFDKVCTNKSMYTRAWRDTLVAELMQSEHREYIARKWANKQQLLMIRGHVVGVLSETGVLKKNRLAVARAYLDKSDTDLSKEVKTFAKYMGDSRREPYFDWVKKYVEQS